MDLTKPIIVIDLEATCCDVGTIKREDMEIIQIGACYIECDGTTTIVREFNKYVKPTINPILTPFCTELTGITQQQVDSADKFAVVYDEFKDWAGSYDSYYLASWGDYDRKQFMLDCNRARKRYELGSHFNLKNMFNGKRMGLTKALNHCSMQFVGQHHSAIDDARNTVRLLPYIFQNVK